MSNVMLADLEVGYSGIGVRRVDVMSTFASSTGIRAKTGKLVCLERRETRVPYVIYPICSLVTFHLAPGHSQSRGDCIILWFVTGCRNGS